MPFPLPQVDIRAPPADFDALIDWLESWSTGLVLLADYPVIDLRESITAVERAVRAHRVETDHWLLSLASADEETARGARIVLHDHEWFETSLGQLGWFFAVVEREDHGGHRQALGQYGRVVAEALRRHRRDERWLEARRTTSPARSER